MRGEPQIEVCCDRCKEATEIMGMTALARGSYDERNIDRQLDGMGWTIDNGEDICPDCTASVSNSEHST